MGLSLWAQLGLSLPEAHHARTYTLQSPVSSPITTSPSLATLSMAASAPLLGRHSPPQDQHCSDEKRLLLHRLHLTFLRRSSPLPPKGTDHEQQRRGRVFFLIRRQRLPATLPPRNTRITLGIKRMCTFTDHTAEVLLLCLKIQNLRERHGVLFAPFNLRPGNY